MPAVAAGSLAASQNGEEATIAGMTQGQLVILGILVLTIAMFLWGRWRHDMVALAALIAAVFAGVVPSGEAFAGFGHPAVITVACVLILSRALQTSGAFELVAHRILPGSLGPTSSIALLSLLVTVPSAFMNNVGALALVMPLALNIAEKNGMQPGRVLMPVAFGSILGGMTTLIGTPPNLIVSSFRASFGEQGFAMFDFTPVGVAVALSGLAFITLIGWRLVPDRKDTNVGEFAIGDYLTEARVPKGAKAAGMTLREIETVLDEADAQIVGFIRNDVRLSAPNPMRKVRPGDILVIEADPKALTSVLATLGLKLAEAVRNLEAGKEETSEEAKPEDGKAASSEAEAEDARVREDTSETALVELAILPDSSLAGRSASDIRLRTSFGINFLAISRQGRRSIARLRTLRLQAGDVLLMQGPPEAIADFASRFGCVPLAERSLRLPDRRQALAASAIMLGSVGIAVFGIVSAAVSFAAGVLASMVFRTVPLRRIYDAIDWPLIVLLGALIPVADAMATTGTADLLAQWLLAGLAQGNAVIALALILVVTMTLSDFMNNAATAAVMCPIAVRSAEQLSVNPDAFLMAVAVGSSCAFLTPIGHQNNLLIMGPGGFRFGDYWKLGLPLEIIVVVVGIPMIMMVWPL